MNKLLLQWIPLLSSFSLGIAFISLAYSLAVVGF